MAVLTCCVLVTVAVASPTPSSAPRPAASTPPPLEQSPFSLRIATDDDIESVAALQIDVFVPPPLPPPSLPLLASYWLLQQAESRKQMRKRLAADLRRRVDKGSTLLVASAPRSALPATDESAVAPTSMPSLSYEEDEDELLLGTVDLSTQELELPTHGIADDAMYLSHLCVLPAYRRQGVGRRLLEAAQETASACGAYGIYLHVERANGEALGLYQSAGFATMPSSAMYVTFTRALNLQQREPLLLHKVLVDRV